MGYSDIHQVDLGELIEKRMADIHMSRAELSRAVNMDQSNLNKQLRKPSMDTGRLTLFSMALRYNFFMAFTEKEEYQKLKDDDFTIDEKLHIGGIIKAIMIANKMTQDDLCNRLMKNEPGTVYRRSDISKLVARKTVDTSKLVKISNALGVNLMEFFCMDVYDRMQWLQTHYSQLGEYNEEDDSSTFGKEMMRKSKETEDIIEKLSQVKADYAVLQFKYRILQKRLKEAGLPWEVEDTQ